MKNIVLSENIQFLMEKNAIYQKTFKFHWKRIDSQKTYKFLRKSCDLSENLQTPKEKTRLLEASPPVLLEAASVIYSLTEFACAAIMLVSASHSFLCNLQLSVLRLSASLDNMSSTLELSPERPQLSDRLEFQSSMTLADGTQEVLGDTRSIIWQEKYEWKWINQTHPLCLHWKKQFVAGENAFHMPPRLKASWDEHSVRAYLNKYAEYVCHRAESRHETDWVHEDEQLREQLEEAKLTLSATGVKSSLKTPKATERVLPKTHIQDLQLQRLNLRKQYRKAVAKTCILLYCDWKGARDRWIKEFEHPSADAFVELRPGQQVIPEELKPLVFLDSDGPSTEAMSESQSLPPPQQTGVTVDATAVSAAALDRVVTQRQQQAEQHEQLQQQLHQTMVVQESGATTTLIQQQQGQHQQPQQTESVDLTLYLTPQPQQTDDEVTETQSEASPQVPPAPPPSPATETPSPATSRATSVTEVVDLVETQPLLPEEDQVDLTGHFFVETQPRCDDDASWPPDEETQVDLRGDLFVETQPRCDHDASWPPGETQVDLTGDFFVETQPRCDDDASWPPEETQPRSDDAEVRVSFDEKFERELSDALIDLSRNGLGPIAADDLDIGSMAPRAPGRPSALRNLQRPKATAAKSTALPPKPAPASVPTPSFVSVDSKPIPPPAPVSIPTPQQLKRTGPTMDVESQQIKPKIAKLEPVSDGPSQRPNVGLARFNKQLAAPAKACLDLSPSPDSQDSGSIVTQPRSPANQPLGGRSQIEEIA